MQRRAKQFGGSLVIIFLGFAATASLQADVRVWTNKETIILKGELKGLEIIPPGAPSAKPSLKSSGKFLTTPPKRVNKKRKGKLKARAPRIIQVGPGEEFRYPSEAAAIAVDGDTIEIKAGLYVDCATWKANNLTIRGIGGRAHIKDEICRGKGIWNINGTNMTIENIEFSGMKNRSKNGAGIRHQSTGLTVRNSYFHDGEEGILGGLPGGKTLIEDSRFERLGKSGQAHPIYIGKVDAFILRRSVVRDCVDQANCVKTRALRSTITCNVIASLNSNSSWEIDLPNGGRAEVRNNVIQQGPKSVNNNIIGFAMETKNVKRRNPEQLLIMENNIVINDKNNGSFIFVKKRENTKIQVKGNKFVGEGILEFKKGNETFPNRKSANLPAYPKLPSACAD